jgi:redox-sensitive bicupin YhaK (pirin superfamily)
MSIEILHRDDLELGGFAGLKEHRIIMDSKAFGTYVNPRTWEGIGNLVYLADARFNPKGETHMHDHREIDVISVMVEGRIAHYDVQAQRAGGEEFSHNEINPDDVENRMIQLWVLPDKKGQPAGYKVYHPKWGEVVDIYGGTSEQKETFGSQTFLKVGMMNPNQKFNLENEFIAYLTTGKGIANGKEIDEGDLIRGTGLDFEAMGKSQLIIAHT